MATPPDAFLSYTRFDDQNDGGAISEFRRHLANAVRAMTGEPFEIFQDIDGIGLGEKWSDKLDQLLADARFFIPVLTPSYFNSSSCRDELKKFLQAESERGRDDLVLPIYWVNCAILEEPELRQSDPLASIIHARQYWDWRSLRFQSVRSKEIRRAIENIARGLGAARRRVSTGSAIHSGIITEPVAFGPEQRDRNQIFISYSKKDREWLERLQDMLKPVVRKNQLTVWDDTHIEPGSRWRLEVGKALKSARVAVLLVSPNFLASDFIAEHELIPLLAREAEGGVKILWVSLSASMYRHTQIADYQCVNDPSAPLDTFSPPGQNRELVGITEAIVEASGIKSRLYSE